MQVTQTISNFSNELSLAYLTDLLGSILNEKRTSFELKYIVYQEKRKVKKVYKTFKEVKSLIFDGESISITPHNYLEARVFFDNSQDLLNNSKTMQSHCEQIRSLEEFDDFPRVFKSYVNLTYDFVSDVGNCVKEIEKGLNLFNSGVKPSELPEGVRALTEGDLWKERNKSYQFVI
ncbi:hypothetical protein [Microscilla marina]|uniref:Uncharacterized protein n=1 Tax=Microscilla marina ATCC 23134 TaxID=313606 RepID=A1ZJK2_MICM2|nr:hypothetical protein [Microscilla marina]EAY29305.1 hypothetical protein M23134_01359 [Microscilla marina ATCC 23134]